MMIKLLKKGRANLECGLGVPTLHGNESVGVIGGVGPEHRAGLEG